MPPTIPCRAGTPFRRCASFGCWPVGALDRARVGGAEYFGQDGRSVLRGACMVRFVPYGVWLISLVLCLAGAATQAADASAVAASAASDTQAHAFDFLMGTWRVQNRLLAKRLQHSHQWLQFQSTDLESPLRTGTGNLEYYLTDHWPNFVGMGLRLYDPQTRKWAIYWSDNRFSNGVLQPPVTGDFHDGRGVFEGPDHLNTIPIIVRYTWR